MGELALFFLIEYIFLYFPHCIYIWLYTAHTHTYYLNTNYYFGCRFTALQTSIKNIPYCILKKCLGTTATSETSYGAKCDNINAIAYCFILYNLTFAGSEHFSFKNGCLHVLSQLRVSKNGFTEEMKHWFKVRDTNSVHQTRHQWAPEVSSTPCSRPPVNSCPASFQHLTYLIYCSDWASPSC